MGKKKKAEVKIKKWRKLVLAHQGDPKDLNPPKICKAKCCKKYKKGEKKRCTRCPCYDLLKRVA